ncbi:MAG: methionine gamma-lyase family protein, partial [Syntrophomonadaceae bacterium]|nr:methionine gamma-lyase family protein [Syntrophomonadaceae bacterium]
QGLFLAPHMVGEALKGAVLAARLFESLGLEVKPHFSASRGDIIQAVKLGHPTALIEFCQAVQCASPVDSMAVPVPGRLPGYDHEVIMAAGTFVQGATLELSADAPMREPFIAYLQGGLTADHTLIATLCIAQKLADKKLLPNEFF